MNENTYENAMDTNNKISGAPEDGFTAMIEAKTSQIPSSAYLAAALVSIATSAIFKASGKDHAALFVGQWAAPFLLLGVYNKMVKQHGSDAESKLRGEQTPARTRTAAA
ncbi:MAG: hypothetical protein ABLT11_05350 [Candidatus Acidiferrum sp.]